MESAYKILLVIVLLLVIFELFQALYFMIRDKGRGKRTVRALARRVAVQILLVVLVLVGYWMGWLHLHGAAPQQHNAPPPPTSALRP